MDRTLTNQNFQGSIQQLRRWLPYLAFGLLMATYLISAIIMGLFHAQGNQEVGFIISAFAVPLIIQAGRGTLVFFFQLNPIRVKKKHNLGIIAATVLLILSLVEAILVMWEHGLSWTVSVATLMIIGWIIEIMILKEVEWSTEIDFYQNPEQVQQLKNYYLAKKDFEQFLGKLDNSKAIKSLSRSKRPKALKAGK